MSIRQSVGCPLSRRGVRDTLLARWLQLAGKGTALSPEQSAQQLGDTCSDLVRGIWMDCEQNWLDLLWIYAIPFVWKPLSQSFHPPAKAHTSPQLSLKDTACILFLLPSASRNCTYTPCSSPGPAHPADAWHGVEASINVCGMHEWRNEWISWIHTLLIWNLWYVGDRIFIEEKFGKKYSNLGFYCLCSSLLRNASLSFPRPHYFPRVICRIITTQETAFPLKKQPASVIIRPLG